MNRDVVKHNYDVPFVLHEISVLIELTLGHLCYSLTDVPPQPNSPPDVVSRVAHRKRLEARTRAREGAGRYVTE